MPSHPDDFSRDVQDVEVDVLADGILIAEVELGKALVNNSNYWGMLVIRRCEEAATLEGNPHYLQIIGLHGVEGRLLHLRLGRGLGLPFEPKWHCGITPHGHGRKSQRGGLNPRDRSELRLNPAPGGSNGIGVWAGCRRERQPKGEQVMGIEAGIDTPELGKRANHQSSAGQQYERERHFCDHENALGAMPDAAQSTPSLLEHFMKVGL